MSKSMNKHQVARYLDRAALTGNLSPDLAQQCESLVGAIDAGTGGIPAKTEALIATAWATTARAAAAAERPADQRKALAGLRAVAELEARLGLAPIADDETGDVADADGGAGGDADNGAETPSYSTSYTGYGYGSEAAS